MVSSKKTVHAIKFVKQMSPGKGDILCSDTDTSFTLTDWHLQNHIETTETATDQERSSSRSTYTIFKFTVRVSREWRYWLYNIYTIMFLLVSLSATSWAAAPTDTGTRLGVTFTLLLTVVAFKFSLTQNIPKVSYNTVLDTYLLWCFVFLVIVATENALVAKYLSDPNTEYFFFIALSALWIIYNLWEIFRVVLQLSIYNRKMEKKNNIFQSQQNLKLLHKVDVRNIL